MSSDVTPQSSRELANLLGTIDSGETAEQTVLKYLIARAGEKDPELGEVIRYCAIPRRFDAAVIGALRQAPDDREVNQRFADELLRFSFIRALPDGGYAYHDSTRDILLEEWRTPDKRNLFEELNQRLVAFYKKQYEDILRLEEDLNARPKSSSPATVGTLSPPWFVDSVALVIQHANLARFAQVMSVFEMRLVTPLLEALYHKSLQSAEVCYRYFVTLYQEQEEAGRLVTRESLLSATRDLLTRMPSNSGQEAWLKWLQYWKGRLKREVRQYNEAERILLDVLQDTGDDVTLRLWVLGDLGASYYEQSKLREARDRYQDVLTLARDTGADPYNLPVWYTRLAQLHWSLEELDQAAVNYREAIKCAKDNPGIEVSARVDLSGVLYALGDWPGALNNIIETLHLARTKLSSDRNAYRSVTAQLMSLLGRREPRLLDTIYLETQASFVAANDPLAPLRCHQQYVTLLREGGQLRRAEEQLEILLARAAKQPNELFLFDLLREQAFLFEDKGELEKAIEKYDELEKRAAAHEEAGAWHYAVALSNRGILRTKIGLWSQAETDLLAAIDKWHEMTHDKLEAFIQSSLAVVLRHQGRLSQAQASIDQALSVLSTTQSSYLNEVYQEQGEVFRVQGRKEDAGKNYQEAFDGYFRVDQFKVAARSLGSLTMLAADRGDWADAAACTKRANKIWQDLADMNNYQPSPAAEKADKENANGVQAFFASDEKRVEKIRKGRESLRSATRESPDNFWYQLNLAYACAKLEEWPEAVTALENVLKLSPEWLRAPMLYERLADYRARQGEKMFGDGQYEEAARFYSESLFQLESHVPFERLAEIELRLSDSYLELGRLRDAQTEYQAGLSGAVKAGNLLFQAAFHARLGFLKTLQSDSTSAFEHFRTNVELRKEAGETELFDDLIDVTNEFNHLIVSITQYRSLGEARRALMDDRSLAGTQAARLIDAQLELSRERYQATRRPVGEATRIATGSELSIPAPIVLEADSRLFPLDEGTPEVKRMIDVDIPAMRQEMIHKQTGVTLPGVRIRANDNFGEGVYVLSLNETPIEMGTVFAKEKFCSDAARCRELGIEGRSALDPATGSEGFWLPETAWAKAEENGQSLVDPYQYMILHLGVVLRRHLANFLGIEEVKNMVTQWKEEAEEDRKEILEKAVPNDAALVPLAQVLQHLVEEDVSIRNLTPIVTTFAELHSTSPDLIDVIEGVRAAVRSDLPVNRGSRKLIGLSPDFEASVERSIQELNNKRFLAMSGLEAQKLVNALKTRIADGAGESLGLIVNNSNLRPFVWRLVKMEWPLLAVGSVKELAEGTKPPEERIELIDDGN